MVHLLNESTPAGAETLSGQCFGAKQYKALGVTLQKSLLINWLACALIMLGWTQIHYFLAAAGVLLEIQDH